MSNYTTEFKARGTYSTVPNIHRALSDLTPPEFKVYAAICNYLRDKNPDPDTCHPSQKVLAEATGYSTREIIRTVKGIAAKGFVEVAHRTVHGIRRGNIYRIIQIEQPPQEKPSVAKVYDASSLGY